MPNSNAKKTHILKQQLHLSIYYNTWSHRRNFEDAMRGKCPSNIFLPKNSIFVPWVEEGGGGEKKNKKGFGWGTDKKFTKTN